ncbi:MAG: glycosyltransferase [Actinobacteria bacterium]|nr:glycosyltransferase [Actinomycetota bacterium]
MTDFINEPLDNKVLDQINQRKYADIVIGIPTYNNENTVANIITNSGEGLKKYYSNLKGVILNADSSSEDNTVDAVNRTRLPKGIEKISTGYFGEKGKGAAIRAILEGARLLDAKVCIICEADTKSVTPEWIYSLVNPVLKSGYGFVSPYYIRNEHDATINNALAYPLTRALYGLRIRQPIGGDFSFSNGVLQVFTRKKYWMEYPSINKFGVDIWMTTTALNEGFRVCQSVLGTKLHDENPKKDINPIFKQVAGTLFGLMKNYEYRWRDVVSSISGFIMGDFKFVEAERLKANYDELLQKFYIGLDINRNTWKSIFDESTHREFKEVLNSNSPENIVLSVELWTKIVYEFACAYNFIPENEKDQLLDAMLPFYYLRTASFIREAELFSDEIADIVVEGNAGVFERLKWYLLNRWDSYKNRKGKISIKK